MNFAFNLLACPTCRVDPGSVINHATNGAVFVMLGFMAVVFGGFLTLAISFARRQRAIGEASLAGVPSSVPGAPSGH